MYSIFFLLFFFVTLSLVEAQTCSSFSGTGYLYNNGTTITSTIPIETRPVQSYTLKQVAFGTGTPLTLFTTTTNGPGNVQSLQYAVGASSSAGTLDDSVITITVDGVVVGTVAAGLLFLTYDLGSSPGYVVPFLSNDISLSYYTAPVTGSGLYGAFRSLFIPYTQNCSITILNSGTASTVWSTVSFRSGGFPNPLIYGSQRIKFHLYSVALNGAPHPAAYAAIPVLPTVTGPGVLDSIQLFGWGNTLNWVEGLPNITSDGLSYTTAGTEDFFGVQFALDFPTTGPYVMNKWGVPSVVHTLTGSNTNYQMSGYRFFHDADVFPFQNSLTVTFFNGNAAQGGGSSSNQFSYMTIYYTLT